MFERYTEKARRVIFFARYEASQFGSPYIETEHILLGLLRDDKALFARLLPGVEHAAIRKEVEEHTVVKERVTTSVDLPLSNASKRVLAYAAEEAALLEHAHIGTEHMLLALLREKKEPGGELLVQRGADLDKLRLEVKKLPTPWHSPRNYAISPRRPPTAPERLVIHGRQRDMDSVRDIVARYRQHSFHWTKQPWTSRDIVVDRNRGSISFDVSLAADAANFEVAKGVWKKDYCVVCGWTLCEAAEDEAHNTGYTNGRDWLCLECYNKFFKGPDFFASPYSDIT
jgi:Clp amino terminal domain, pathogenicity island component